MDLNKHVTNYRIARENYNAVHKASQVAHQTWKQAEADFISAMVNGHIKTFTHLETGEVFGLSEHFAVAVNRDNNDAVRAWLVDEDGDDAPYLTEVCDKASVTRFVRGLVETNRKADRDDEDGIPDFLKLKTRPVLSHRNKNG